MTHAQGDARSDSLRTDVREIREVVGHPSEDKIGSDGHLGLSQDAYAAQNDKKNTLH